MGSFGYFGHGPDCRTIGAPTLGSTPTWEGSDRSRRPAVERVVDGAVDGAAGHRCRLGNPDTVVIVPMYNEAAVSPTSCASCRRSSPMWSASTTAVPDGCAGRGRGAGAVVVRHPVNLGQGAALQTGFEYALLQPGACATSSPSTPTASTRSSDVARDAREGRAPRTSTSSSAPASSTDARTPSRRCRRWCCALAVRLHPTVTTGLHADRRPQRPARAQPRRRSSGSTSRRTGWRTPPRSVARSAQLELRYVEVPVHILYTDYSQAKGQSLSTPSTSCSTCCSLRAR